MQEFINNFFFEIKFINPNECRKLSTILLKKKEEKISLNSFDFRALKSIQ